jgi:hypothetical protein
MMCFFLSLEGIPHIKIRLIEGNSKCRHLKKLTCEGTLRQVFICLRPRNPSLNPLTHCIRVYSILIHTGKGGEGEEFNQREGKRGNRVEYSTDHIAGLKIPT